MSNIKPLQEVLTMTQNEISKLTHTELTTLVFALITEVLFKRNTNSTENKLIEQQIQVMNATINSQRTELQKANIQIDTHNKNMQQYIKRLYKKLTWKERLIGHIKVDNIHEQ